MFKEEYKNFVEGLWTKEIDVRDFIIKNITPYIGDDSFLADATDRTKKLWEKADKLIIEEVKTGKVDIETNVFAGINNFKPGYLDKDNELIIGFQTDKPLKRIINPFGGLRMVESSLKAYNTEANPELMNSFRAFRKTHNEGVFDAYTTDMLNARKVGLLTGLPDAYGRGRIIGDYRRVALYGVDFLVECKKEELLNTKGLATEELIRRREEISMQLRALNEIKEMAATYGIDISKPAKNAKEAIQFIYFGYLAGVKENNGAAMSLGRNTAFIDIYIEREIEAGSLTEETAQELIDQFVIKLRMVRHLRTPEYDELFAGDPNWITEAIGGMGEDNRTHVTKTAFRFLHTLTNLGPAPEPNMTVLWSEELPKEFKKYCAKMSIQTDAIQYENDDLMRPLYGDDYGIACCVSAMRIGKESQFFGARTNLGKALLFALNGGIDEIMNIPVVPGIEGITDGYLDYNEVKERYFKVLEFVAEVYVNTMNTIHYMHDKYAYEAGQFALHDAEIKRYMAFGIAGISIVADSLSAIKNAKVKPIRDERGLTVDFEIEGEFPMYGNDEDSVDDIAVEIVKKFSSELKKHATYRNAEHTLSALTITSNVVYGKKTGSTPDGRKAGEPFAPGANPMHGRDANGALASLNSVAKIPYEYWCQDGVSNTMSIIPKTLGRKDDNRINNLVGILDGYFVQGGFHLNVNVLDRQTLINAMERPEDYPNLTIRVSGYAVHFNRLTKAQQLEVISRTFHEAV